MSPARPPRGDHTHVVLLRGVNVGPRNRVPKEDLVRWAEAAGAQDVTTHLASGNILFRLAPAGPGSAPVTPEDVVAGVREGARRERGLEVPVLWTTPAELREALAVHDALPWAGGEPRHTQLTLLAQAPGPGAAERLAALDHGPADAPDRSVLAGRFLWIRHAAGVSASPLTLPRLERALGTTGTARNLATVRVLAGVS